MKKMSLPIILSSFILFGLFFSTGHQKDVTAAKAEPETPTPVATFNVFAGGWNPQTYGGSIARYILTFEEELGENNGDDFTNDIGDHFQLNGVSLKTLRETDAQVLIGHNNQGAKNLFIRFDTSHIVATEDYPTPIFHIDEGTPFQNYLLPELTFVVNPSTYTMKQSSTLSFSTYNNNIDYTNPHPMGGDHGYGEAPTNGAMMRILFDKNILGDDLTANYEDHTSIWGQNVTMNGVKLSSIDGALVGASFGRLFIFVPKAVIDQTDHDYYLFPTLHIENAYFDVCELPEMTFRFAGAIGFTESWSMREPTELTFVDFNNNIDYTNAPHPGGGDHAYGQAPTNGAVLRIRFNENLIGDGNGPVYKDFTSIWGQNVTMNGVKLSSIEGALIGASFGRLYIFVPTAAVELTNYDYYLFPTLHIKNTYFEVCKLPEMTFRFTGSIGVTDSWTKYEPAETDIVPEDQYLTTNDFSDLFTDDTEVGKEKMKLVGQVPEYTNETNFAFEFRNDSKEGSLALYIFSNDDFSGIRLTVDLKNNKISLLDTSSGVVLDVLAHPLRNYEWYRIYFGIKFNDNNTIDYSFAIDDVIYLTGDDVPIGSMDYFGRKIAIYSGIGITSFSDPRPTNDIKKPFVTYSGEESCHYNVGSDKPDLKALCTSNDDVDGDVSELIKVIWPDGSLTDNKLNKGNWTITIKSSDNSGNFDVLYINIVVSDPNEVLVTFDGQNATYYSIGSLIEKPEDPVKKEDKHSTYSFIGWFNGETQWDFENDHVTEDLDLVAKFQKNDRKYTISMVVDNDTTTLELLYGAKIDLTTYKKDGYLMTVTCDGAEYLQDFYEVRAEATITISYQKIDDPINPVNPTDNSRKELTGLYIGLACGGAALVIGAEVLVLILKKKDNKKED